MQAVGEPWVAALETTEYRALPLAARLAMLGALVQLALEGPSARAALEARLEEAARVRKAMAEDAKVRLFAACKDYNASCAQLTFGCLEEATNDCAMAEDAKARSCSALPSPLHSMQASMCVSCV